MDKKKEILIAINRTDSLLERAAVMLSTGKRDEPLPEEVKFTELELKSYQNSLITLACKLLKVPHVSTNLWYPPVDYAYKSVIDQEIKTKWTWLEKFYDGLKNTKEFFASFLVDTANTKEYNIQIENSTGVIVSIENTGSPIQLINSLTENEFELFKDELKRLRESLKVESDKTMESDLSIGYVAAAEIAAKNKDKEAIISNLRKAGNWVFDTASKIGVSVASKVISEIIKN